MTKSVLLAACLADGNSGSGKRANNAAERPAAATVSATATPADAGVKTPSYLIDRSGVAIVPIGDSLALSRRRPILQPLRAAARRSVEL